MMKTVCGGKGCPVCECCTRKITLKIHFVSSANNHLTSSLSVLKQNL